MLIAEEIAEEFTDDVVEEVTNETASTTCEPDHAAAHVAARQVALQADLARWLTPYLRLILEQLSLSGNPLIAPDPLAPMPPLMYKNQPLAVALGNQSGAVRWASSAMRAFLPLASTATLQQLATADASGAPHRLGTTQHSLVAVPVPALGEDQIAWLALSDADLPQVDTHDQDHNAPREHTLTIDGRRLGYAEYGPVNGQPVLLMHNWAGSRLQVPLDTDSLHTQGIRLIVPDQPGYGLSDPIPCKDAHDGLKQWPGVVAQLADALNLQHFAVMGYCSGAMQALACARAMPRRITRVVLISPFAPVRNLADIAGLQASGRLMHGAMPHLTSPADPLLRLWLTHIRRHAGRYLDHVLMDMSLRNHATLTGDAQQARFSRSFAEAIYQHGGTPLAALRLMASDWSYLLSTSQPVTIWHGDEDRCVPPSHCQRLALSLPRAKLHRLPNVGHYLYYSHWSDILATLHDNLSIPPTPAPTHDAVPTSLLNWGALGLAR